MSEDRGFEGGLLDSVLHLPKSSEVSMENVLRKFKLQIEALHIRDDFFGGREGRGRGVAIENEICAGTGDRRGSPKIWFPLQPEVTIFIYVHVCSGFSLNFGVEGE